jgi:flagellin-like protein
MKKKSQSEIIGTVLMILIVVAAVVILGNIVVPMIQELLGDSGNCFEASNKVRVEEGKYTCFNDSQDEMYVQIHMEDLDIKGFKIEVTGVKSRTVEITNGKDGTVEKVTMYRDSATLEMPPKNGASVYNISGISEKPDSIKVYPILKNEKVCEASHSINEVNNCFSI